MRISNPAMRAIADAMERDEVLRWSNSLTRARVTRWGGMISTPDEVLQVRILNTRLKSAKLLVSTNINENNLNEEREKKNK